MTRFSGSPDRTARALWAAALSVAICAAPGAGLAQLGPDDGPDITISGQGGDHWVLTCESISQSGQRRETRAGGPAMAGQRSAEFRDVGYLSCYFQAGRDAPLRLRLDKRGGQPFCPFAQRDPANCVTRLAPGQHASFEFEAVP